jgi:hypothetical protein
MDILKTDLSQEYEKYMTQGRIYYPEMFTNLPQVTDKLNHIKVVSSTPRHEWNSNSQN